ncbi:MAG: methyltransferase [Desulfurococcaceae archaeon]
MSINNRFQQTLCIAVKRELGEKARKILAEHGLLNRAFKVARSSDYIYLPVIDCGKAGRLLAESSMDYLVTECIVEESRLIRAFNVPSHDYVDGVIILREQVLEERDLSELIELFKGIYKKLKAVYLKKGVSGESRVSELVLLWGSEVSTVMHKEYGLRFLVDIHKVYFNPRLSVEHRLLAKEVNDGELVVDAFSGFGGFSIHIASLRRCKVLANDVNPHALVYLAKNIDLNKRFLKGSIVVVNGDSSQMTSFLRKSIADRIIADIPHRSIEFMEVYNYLAKKGTILHLYLVSKGLSEALESSSRLVEEDWRPINVRKVLEYSPAKNIFRVDFRKL